MNTDRSYAESRDSADPLARFRDEFFISDDNLVYLNGNSLGRLPRRTSSALAEFVTFEWGTRLSSGWESWVEVAERTGEVIASSLVGARAGEVIVSDSTSVNLYKLASAALDARPGRSVIVTDTDNFPSDRYVLEGLAAARGLGVRWLEPDPIEGPSEQDLSTTLADDVALVSLSHVNYRNGSIADMAAITRLAHSHGALMLWDLCHSVGVVPIDLSGCEVDLAVGCTYKYLNAGPGAPAFLYVREELQEELAQPIWGWFGQTDQFEFGPRYEPAKGIARFLVGTPPLIALAGVEEGVALAADAGIKEIRVKSTVLTEYAIALFDEWLASFGVGLGSPRESSARGSHVALLHDDAAHLCEALIKQKVIPDFRPPNIIRFGASPLYTRFTDIWDGMDRLRAALSALPS